MVSLICAEAEKRTLIAETHRLGRFEDVIGRQLVVGGSILYSGQRRNLNRRTLATMRAETLGDARQRRF